MKNKKNKKEKVDSGTDNNLEITKEAIGKQILKDLGLIVGALIKKAKKGDVRAIRELFDGCWQKIIQSEKQEQIFTPEQRYKLAKRIVEEYEATHKKEAQENKDNV